jgi:hypothetical protein
MVGACAQWRDVSLPEWVTAAGIASCVEFIGPVSRDEIRRMIASSNVLINLAQGQKCQIPAKLFEHVASCRAVLLFAESDSDSALVASDVKTFLRVDDTVEAVTEALRTLYGRYVGATCGDKSNTVELATTLSRRQANGHFRRLMEDVTHGKTRFG